MSQTPLPPRLERQEIDRKALPGSLEPRIGPVGSALSARSYDASYLRDVLDADPRALLAFSKAAGISNYRKDVPPAVYCAAGLVGAMAEDCGPCTQLGLDMAQRAGVDPAVLRAVVARDFEAMPEGVALAVRFAEASLRHAPAADELREERLRR